jgi:hypothetical protein
MTMKSSFVFLILLLLGASAQAQHSNSHTSWSSASNSNSFSGGGGRSGSDHRDQGGWYGSGRSGSRRGGGRYEPPQEYSTGAFTNDGPYVPSTFMTFDEALALGKQQLASTQTSSGTSASPSLGEVARALRANKLRPEDSRVLVSRDNIGPVVVCAPGGSACHTR